MLNIFQSIKRKKYDSNITDLWEKKDIPLQVDFDPISICGIGLGECVEKFSFLGVSDLTESRKNIFEYKKKGLSISERHGIVRSFFITVRKNALFHWYRGEWRFRGNRINISADTKREYIRTFLGAPVNSWDDGCYMCYMYERGDLDIEIIWNWREKLEYVRMAYIYEL